MICLSVLNRQEIITISKHRKALAQVYQDRYSKNLPSLTIQKINEDVREWEILYNDKGVDFDKWVQDENVIRKFNSILNYNKPFVNFLVNFYGLQNKKILDYGCGLGTFSHLFSFFSSDVSGCDISKRRLDYARMKNNDVNYFEDDFFHSSLKKNSFDFIFCRDLGPLLKIDYNKENVAKLDSIISALKEDGIAYFILMGDLSGNHGNRVSGFQNHSLKTIFDFFSAAGHISMINVFGYQAVIVTKNLDLAQQYRQKMNELVQEANNYLGNFDYVGYLKCKLWLYINGDFNSIQRKEFIPIDNFIKNVYSKKIIRGLFKINEPKTVSKPSNFFLVSGDHDEYFSYHFMQELLFYTMKPSQILKKYGKKFLKK